MLWTGSLCCPNTLRFELQSEQSLGTPWHGLLPNCTSPEQENQTERRQNSW